MNISHLNNTVKKSVNLRKIKNGIHTYSMSGKCGDKFIIEIQVGRALGITDISAEFDEFSLSFTWCGIHLSDDKYTLDLTDTLKNAKHKLMLDISLRSNCERYYIDTADGKLSNEYAEYNLTTNKPRKIVFTVEDDNPHVNASGCIYHIFVDRFNKVNPAIRSDSRYNADWDNGIPEYAKNTGDFLLNNTHFGGNFKGIEEKLDYLSELSVDYIYLSPISKAFSNHKYDVGSYFQIDENLGGEENLISLINACHKKDIKIILDCVFNHTGDNSEYFNKYGKYNSVGAYQSKESPYYSWYSFKSHPDDYESWWGIKCLPSISKGCEDFMNYICGEHGVIDYYMSLGVDGIRLDVADELTIDFIKQIKSAVNRNNKTPFIIGEVWENATRKNAYGEDKFYFETGKLDSVMNYPLLNAIIDFIKNGNTKALDNTLADIYCDYPERCCNLLLNIISTHDTKRFISNFTNMPKTNEEKAHHRMSADEYNKAVKRIKSALVMQSFLPGIPCIYYGDEIGMQGFDDPFNRMPMKWSKIDTKLLEWYKKILKIRKNNRPLNMGGFIVKYLDNGIFVFDRTDGHNTIRVIINASENTLKYNVKGYDLINENEVSEIIITPFSSGCINL